MLKSSANSGKVFGQRRSALIRVWLAKLETNHLKRQVGLDIRYLLGEALKGDQSLYDTLPIRPPNPENNSSVDDNLDILPLIKHVAESGKPKCTLGQFLKLCEAYNYSTQIGVSLFNPLEILDKSSESKDQ